ncbi:uncharacterized protein [Dysidea avara]|uniref:uncharacterized protein isoform X2 n=1 Tax=Dysidea avara TaxID=196820 RepID=UPI0033221CD2
MAANDTLQTTDDTNVFLTSHNYTRTVRVLNKTPPHTSEHSTAPQPSTYQGGPSGQPLQATVPPVERYDEDDDQQSDDRPLPHLIPSQLHSVSEPLLFTKIDKNEVPKQGQYPSHKVVMFGTSQVGKSSILAYLDTGKFTDAASTNDGVSQKIAYFKENNTENIVKLKIWDTGSGDQDNLVSVTTNIYDHCEVAIIVFDTNNEDTLKLAKVWMETIKEQVKDFPTQFLLTANKCDFGHAANDVVLTKARKFANNSNMSFYQTSARDGLEIDDLFCMAVIKACEAKMQYEKQQEAERKQAERDRLEAERLQQPQQQQQAPQQEAVQGEAVAAIPPDQPKKRCIIL